MNVRRVLLVALGLLSLLVGIKEWYDPFLVLFLGDLVRPKPAPVTVPLHGALAVRLYADPRPHVGKVASLQKGLVLVCEGQEIVEEGFGFGLPIVQVGDVAYLSRHASTSLIQREGRTTLVKSYTIDVADRPTRFLRVKYEAVEPLGTVVFSYTVRGPDTIGVEVDFTGLTVDWDRAYLMNEQGAINFATYQDESGQLWRGDDVGIWRPTDDARGCWRHREGEFRFCVETEPGRRKFVGRERYNQYRWTGVYYLSWSGIDIEVNPPMDRYRYTLRVEAVP